MLPGVLLHQVKPPVPVDNASDFRPRLQGVVAGMDDLPIPAVDLQHLDLPLSARRLQPPGVVGLTAPLRVEGGAVQNDVEAFLPLNAGDHACLEFDQKGVLFVEFFCHR